MEENLTKKERKLLRREERVRQEGREARKAKVRKILFLPLSILIVLAAGYGLWLLVLSQGPGEPQGEDFSVAYPVLGKTSHIPVGSPRPNYNSDPPTSGEHYAETVPRGVHDEEFPDERLVHNLEHGEVWISYKPEIAQETLEVLKDITRNNRKIVLTVRPSNDNDVVLAAWGRLDTFDIDPDGTVSRQRIEDFIERYRNKGPEKIP